MNSSFTSPNFYIPSLTTLCLKVCWDFHLSPGSGLCSGNDTDSSHHFCSRRHPQQRADVWEHGQGHLGVWIKEQHLLHPPEGLGTAGGSKRHVPPSKTCPGVSVQVVVSFFLQIVTPRLDNPCHSNNHFSQSRLFHRNRRRYTWPESPEGQTRPSG